MDASSANLGRALAFALIVPVCLWLGLMLSTPTSAVSLVGVGVVVLALALPLLLRWHSVLLIGCWNALVVVPFLPGQPPMWVLLAGLSLAIAMTNRTLRHRAQFIWVPSVAIPLLLLGVVVMVTVAVRGIGARSFGSELWGGEALPVGVRCAGGLLCADGGADAAAARRLAGRAVLRFGDDSNHERPCAGGRAGLLLAVHVLPDGCGIPSARKRSRLAG